MWNDELRKYVSPEPDAMEVVLRKTIPRVALDGVPFDEAAGLIKKGAGTDIVVNWRALEASGFDVKTPIDLHMRNPSLGAVLDGFVASASEYGALRYGFRDGVIVISSSEEIDRFPTPTRTYDVRDLIGLTADVPSTEQRDRADERVDELIKTVTDFVDPDSWRDVGGTVGAIRELGGMLIVTQTWETHEQLAGVLNDLRVEGRTTTRPTTGPTTRQ